MLKSVWGLSEVESVLLGEKLVDRKGSRVFVEVEKSCSELYAELREGDLGEEKNLALGDFSFRVSG